MINCLNAIASFDQKNVKGTIIFHQCTNDSGSSVIFNLYNLVPNSENAIHIHEYGDLRNGCTSLGGHWNPHNTTHGTIWQKNMQRHAGDLINNIYADEKGTFYFKYYDPLISVKNIYGRSVVIHAKKDDLGFGNNAESLVTGNAGNRIACAIIGRASTN